MWEEEFLSEDVGVTVLTDRNFVPRDEDWADFFVDAPVDVPASGPITLPSPPNLGGAGCSGCRVLQATAGGRHRRIPGPDNGDGSGAGA
ncbi:hypothetical protein FPOAC1_002162 [Fusarium poae]|uniref:hypothetical protein n=1 Tax=Fusarium poae TaxID=36050 RepID=UPI001CE8F63D|nr:hypothetical protein FPOAC1_002162 [Fusarium poae]KAG8676163.1 hypothetical protein FPOAC1_002162 [Fusarium poae]